MKLFDLMTSHHAHAWAEAAFARAFLQAVAVVDPMRVVARHLPPKPTGRIIVIGAVRQGQSGVLPAMHSSLFHPRQRPMLEMRATPEISQTSVLYCVCR